MNKLVVSILLILFGVINLFSQNDSTKKITKFPQIVEINTGYGFIAKHRQIVDYFITGHVPTLNITVGKIMGGNKLWHQKYGNPEIGVGMYYANFNNYYLGEAYSLYGYSKIPFTNRHKKIFGYFDLGMGLAYITKHFDIDENYFNVIIGSHYNAYLRIGVLANLKLSKKFNIITGLSLNHSSNSKTRTPNLGINVINYNLGIKYNLYETNFNINKLNVECDCYSSYYLTISGGIKSVTKVEQQFFASSIVFDYVKNITYKSGFGGGADMFYDKSLVHYYVKDTLEYTPILNDIQFGVHGTYILKFNKVWFNFNVGYYILDDLNIDGKIYSRISMRAYFYRNIYASVGMKTHFAKADLLEIGIGYSLNN